MAIGKHPPLPMTILRDLPPIPANPRKGKPWTPAQRAAQAEARERRRPAKSREGLPPAPDAAAGRRIAALSAEIGLSEEDIRFWEPRLPPGLDDAALAGKLREIAAIREPDPEPLATSRGPVRSRAGVPWSETRRARFEERRRRRLEGVMR